MPRPVCPDRQAAASPSMAAGRPPSTGHMTALHGSRRGSATGRESRIRDARTSVALVIAGLRSALATGRLRPRPATRAPAPESRSSQRDAIGSTITAPALGCAPETSWTHRGHPGQVVVAGGDRQPRAPASRTVAGLLRSGRVAPRNAARHARRIDEPQAGPSYEKGPSCRFASGRCVVEVAAHLRFPLGWSRRW